VKLKKNGKKRESKEWVRERFQEWAMQEVRSSS
jgi:hypothetical protein